MSSRLAWSTLVAFSSLLGGCYVEDDCFDCRTPFLTEQEPNDSAATADWIGPVGPGDQLSILGHVTYWGPDIYDGFAFYTAAPCDIELALWTDDPFADLDVCVYDPDLGQFVFCFETADDPETGIFTIGEAGKPFHLVVTSFAGASTYTLEVRGLALSLLAATSGADPTPAVEHRQGREGFWARYHGPEEDGGEPLLLLPAELITIDLETGAVETEPLLVMPLRHD